MIGWIKGCCLHIDSPYVVIDVGGVGYEVACASRLLKNISIGQEVSWAIETYMRSEILCLYGFESFEERAWFRVLQTVPGVGAKVALSLLSLGSLHQLAHAVCGGDKAFLSQAEGVGPKLVTRLIHELKTKKNLPGVGEHVMPSTQSPVMQDVISALTHLGYRPVEVTQGVHRAAEKLSEKDKTFDMLMRCSLQELRGGGQGV